MTEMFLSKRRILYKIENQLTWRLVDVSWFSSLYKRCVFSRGTFCHWNFRSISSHSWVVLILVRKPLECFGLWSMVLLAYLSDDSLMWADFQFYIRCVFSRGTFLSLKLSLYLLSFLSCIDSREKAFGVFWIMIHGPSSVFIWRLVDVSRFQFQTRVELFERNIFVNETFALSPLIPELYWFSWESLWSVLIMIHGPSSLFISTSRQINTLEGPWIIIQNTPRLSHENQYNSGMRGDRAKVSMTEMFLSKRRIFYINLKISSHQRVVR